MAIVIFFFIFLTTKAFFWFDGSIVRYFIETPFTFLYQNLHFQQYDAKKCADMQRIARLSANSTHD